MKWIVAKKHAISIKGNAAIQEYIYHKFLMKL